MLIPLHLPAHTWHGGRPRSWQHCVRWGPTSPPPNFRPMSIMAKWLDGSRCHSVWRSASAQAKLCEMGTHPPPKGQSPPKNFFGPCLCGKTAGWIKMLLGMEVGLDPCHIVLDGDQAPPPRGTARQLSAHVYCGQKGAHLSYCWAFVLVQKCSRSKATENGIINSVNVSNETCNWEFMFISAMIWRVLRCQFIDFICDCPKVCRLQPSICQTGNQ